MECIIDDGIVIIIGMKEAEETRTRQAFADLAFLQAQHLVPPQMLSKLLFLSSLIRGQQVSQDVVESVPHYERHSLEQLTIQAQKQLLVSIVRCLANKDRIRLVQRQRTYLRKQKSFFNWKKCYFECDSEQVMIYQSRQIREPFLRMAISHLWLSRNYKYYKKKVIFAVYHQGLKYVFGFDGEGTAKRIHCILSGLISDKKQWQCTKYNPNQFSQQNGKFGLQNLKVQQGIIEQQMEYLNILQGKIKWSSEDQEGYKLVKNIEFGRILQNTSNGRVRINLIIKGTDPISFLQAFLLQKQWNKNIETLKIVGHPRDNLYLAYMKTNKYSFISYPRDCYLSAIYYKPCYCRAQPGTNSSFLFLESSENNEEISAGVVRMKLKQIVEISRNPEDQKVLLMTVTSEYDFKGYASLVDNIAMTKHLIENISNYVNYAQKTERKRMFQDIPCPCQGNSKRRNSNRFFNDFSEPTEGPFAFDDVSSISSLKPHTQQKKQYKIHPSTIITTIQKILRGEKQELILQILNNKSYYSYCLKHRYRSSQQQAFINLNGVDKDFFLQGGRWSLEGDDYVFKDEQALAAQKDILKMIIKQLGSNLINGKSVMNMSLPVQIFARKSMLDVIAESLGFLPSYFTKQKLCGDSKQAIKNITTALMFLSVTTANIQKPFNPIIGQTYQGKLGPFIISLQQISHHPPISSVYITSQFFTLWGNFDVAVDMGINSAYSRIPSCLGLRLHPSEKVYKIKMPDVELGGLVYGKRTLKLAGKGFVLDQTDCLFTQVSFGKDKKRVYEAKQKVNNANLYGGLFKVKPEFVAKVMALNSKKSFDGVKAEQVLQTFCFLSGKFYGQLTFGDQIYKSIKQGPFPQKCNKLKYLLPSDSLFRQDVIHRIWGDNSSSNRQKQRLENLQRSDRKLRERR